MREDHTLMFDMFSSTQAAQLQRRVFTDDHFQNKYRKASLSKHGLLWKRQKQEGTAVATELSTNSQHREWGKITV
jgi:hypothetical protein